MAPPQAVPICFPPPSDSPTAHILLELPPELLKLLEGSDDRPSLTIKGRPADSAVLCTANSTYALRTVQVSNELVLLTSPLASEDPFGPPTVEKNKLEWREVLHEVLELTPVVPGTGRIEEVLTGQRWAGMAGDEEESDDEDSDEEDGGPRKRTKYTIDHLRSIVQASDGELDAALKAKNVVTVKGKLLPLPSARLPPLLSLLLSLLVIHSSNSSPAQFPMRAPAQPILQGLKDQGVDLLLGREVLRLFGSSEEKDGKEEWSLEETGARKIVQEAGKGLLMKLSPHDSLPLTTFMSQWQALLPDSLASMVDLPLLSAHYLLEPPPPPLPAHALVLTPYPVARLSPIAQDRFAELFLKRSKWKMVDLKVYLSDLGSVKDVEKMVSKWGRVVKEREVINTRIKGKMVRSEGGVVEWVYSRAR